MNLFYNIPTDSFVPLSHDNAYLFNHYDKIANFLSLHLDRRYRHILAKPIKNNFNIQWYSPYSGLVSSESSTAKELGARKYWEFYKELEAKISELARQDNDNTRDWITLLEKVFNPEDNVLFTNGTDICIIWGWKFENNQMGRADLLQQQNSFVENDDVQQEMDIDGDADKQNSPRFQDEDRIPDDIPPILENDFWLDDSETETFTLPTIDKDDSIIYSKRTFGFLTFLRDFAGTYWWLLIVLLVLTSLVFLYKSLI